MEQQAIEIIAGDLGFGGLKMGRVNGNGIETAVIPQSVGIGTTDIGMLGMGTKQVRKKDKPLAVRIAGEETSWLVGPNVSRYTRTRERLDILRLTEGPELRALLYAGLWQVTGAGAHRVALMVGLPVETTKDAAAGAATMRKLRDWLVGRHVYSVNGEETTQEIEVVNGTAQPLGTYYAWGMNGGGKQMKGALVAVCDIGRKTLDLFAIRDGVIVKDRTEGANLGTHRVTDYIIRHVHETYRFTLSTGEADELLRAHASGKTPMLYHAGGDTDLSAVIDEALDNGFVDINNFIRQYWGRGTQFRYLLATGGGAMVYRSRLLAHYPFAVVMPNAVTANVEGIAMLARRKYATMVR